jgi:hypothetical protein
MIVLLYKVAFIIILVKLNKESPKFYTLIAIPNIFLQNMLYILFEYMK